MYNDEYLEAYDPEALNGRGSFRWTKDKSKALKFKDAGEAFKLYRTIPFNHQVRKSDGMPNRPLTAFNIILEDADDEQPGRSLRTRRRTR